MKEPQMMLNEGASDDAVHNAGASDKAVVNEGRDSALDGRGGRDQIAPEQRHHLGRQDSASVGRIGRRLEG